MEMNKTIAKSNFKIIKRDMFNEDKVLTYSLVCDECCTYEELMKARCNLCDNEDCIEEVLGEPTEIKTYKLDDGREIQFVLTNVETKHSDMRWIIEWYEGVWTETEPPVKKNTITVASSKNISRATAQPEAYRVYRVWPAPQPRLWLGTPPSKDKTNRADEP